MDEADTEFWQPEDVANRIELSELYGRVGEFSPHLLPSVVVWWKTNELKWVNWLHRDQWMNSWKHRTLAILILSSSCRATSYKQHAGRPMESELKKRGNDSACYCRRREGLIGPRSPPDWPCCWSLFGLRQQLLWEHHDPELLRRSHKRQMTKSLERWRFTVRLSHMRTGKHALAWR